ncbi:glycerophosphodiester phosphodiesterase family protein [Vaginella massiliensis]|uniref:glycerophosphodiester phosphodiesterase family protein n=1 Tax=Vaginella massiliensis TaxID=1816680 RepID=UPI00083826AC|nr:glycerophosphodiester phosphodiesterase family protein [Vaginella massiliensis]
MKAYFKIISLLVLMIFWQCKDAPSTLLLTENIVPNSERYFSYAKKNQTLVSAHRGGSGLQHYPENAIETMEYLYAKGISIFEIDVALTRDRKMVLMHDNSLQRTTTGRQDVNQIDLQKLKTYFLVDDFGNETKFKVPTLAETLAWAKGKNLYFMVDIKNNVDYKELIDLIRQHQMENQCVLVSYTIGQAKKLHRLAPEMMLSVSMRNEREMKEHIQSEIPKNRMVAFTGTRLSDPKLYEAIHQHNIMVILGTLGNLDKQAEARGDHLYVQHAQKGIDIFATDRPLEVLKSVNK